MDKIKTRKINKSSAEIKKTEKIGTAAKVDYDKVLKTVERSKDLAVERRGKLKSKELNGQKIRKDKYSGKKIESQEAKLDKAIEKEDNVSFSVMILILIVCFVVGIVLGYMLYRIAIGGSNALMFVRPFFR